MSKLLIRDKIIKTYAFKYIYILISIVTLKVTGCNHPSLFLFCVKSETAIRTDAQYSFSGLVVHLEVPGTSSELIWEGKSWRESCPQYYSICCRVPQGMQGHGSAGGLLNLWMWSVADPSDPKAYAWVPAFPWRTEFKNMNWCSRSGCLPEKCPRWREIAM